jgi:hypothetical protein
MTRALLVIALMLVAACGPAKVDKTDTQPPSSAPADSTLPHFTKADFASLRWLDGRWRGRLPDGKPFFESYAVVNDSTIHQGAFSDSTFQTQTDSSVLGLRGGLLVQQGQGSTWVASHLDSAAVRFDLVKAPANYFTWTRRGADAWEAQLFNVDARGQQQRVVYQMRRVKP